MSLSPEAFAGLARRIRLLLLDVDGVLTDGTIQVGADGSELKSFYIRDGAALVWAQRAGLEVGLLSSRPSAATAHRAAELGLKIVVQTGPDKRQAFDALATSHGFRPDEVAYMGDDLLDLPVFARVALAAAPADAADDVRTRAHWVSAFPGGRGAVREFIEALLRARGEWDRLLNAHLD
jgi:3-deoxy-D-manno-octulosonate 8-phosphate phosphatase (KDO 8-P phosphatase)